jgi:signal transduction histidine kinase/ligand-binding sensor domain-containing protein/DNA-binding response OmpR family regulator
MKYKFYLIVLLFSTNSLFTQIRDFNFRNINISDGLSNNNVSSIVQDKLGQMWFATSNGLNKYNGKEFTVFRNIPREQFSISSSETLSLLVDKDGYIWVGTFNGLNRYDPKKNTFKRFYHRPTVKNSLSNSLVKSILEMPSGNIWFGTQNGVSIYEKKKNRFIRFLSRNKKNGFRSINKMVLDQKNNVWLATNNGLVKVEGYKNNKFKIKEYFLNNKENNFTINNILEITPGIIGVASKYSGYLYFNINTKKFTRSTAINIPQNIEVRDIKIDNDKNTWLATTNGLYIITNSNETIYIKEDRENSYGTIQNFIRTIYKDKNGIIWLGTQNGGVFTWDKSYQNFLQFKNPNLYNNIVNSIVADENANIYFATEGGVVNVLDKKGNVNEIFKIESVEKKINYPIRSLYYQKPGLLFIGTLNMGLIVYDIKTKKIRNDIISDELEKYIGSVSIFDIKKDSKESIYIGTFGKGLIKYNLNSKRLRVFSESLLGTNIIKTIHIDNEDKLLVGGLGGAAALTLDKKGKATTHRYFKDKPFNTFNINVLYKDSQNEIWAGTTTRGLYKLKGKYFRKVSFPRKNIFSTVNSIQEGGNGILWLTTDKGIVKYNPNKNKSFVYNQRVVLSNNDFRQNSSLKINDQIYFGNLNGLTCFNTKKIIRNTKVPNVVLSELKIKNETVPITNKEGVLPESLSYTKVLELDYNNANFSINYALPNYINPEENRYAYRLKGLNNAWTYTKQTEAFFTLQTAGEYTFQVKAANHDNVWTNRTTNLSIIVHPAPYKTWWAYVTYLIAIFGLFYGISWMLQSRARLRNKLQLEYIENQKKEALNKSKLQFFTNISHEFRTPLTLILGPLQNILNDYTGTNAIYKKLKVIEGSANHLLRLINRLMDFRKLESNQLELKTVEGNIVKFLQEIYLSFSEHAKIGKYQYHFNASEDVILVYFDRYKLERVFYNLISNAFRYTPEGGSISIDIKKEKEEVILTVKDSGVGISEEYLDKIFDRFFEIPIHNKPNKNYNKGTGIGLSIANNIVKLHRGSIDVKNQKPSGAIFTVKLQLGHQHLLKIEIQENFKKSDDVSQYAVQINTPEIVESSEIEDALLEDKKFTILIVEDNVVLRSFIKEILKPKYNILQAENGKLAYQKALKHLPDLIVSDVIMPEMVGTELCSKLKTNIATSHIPVILLTSRTSLIYKFEGLESGADDYISKPFDLKEFQLKIHNLLTSKQRIKDKFSSKDNYTKIDVSLPSLDEKMLSKAFQIVQENIANQDFNIEEFSETLGVSRSMLYTKIKAWANATPKDFIQEIRLNQAAKLLELNKFTISEICYKVGFKRPKYFSQIFQKKYGLTPSEFSKKFKSIL